MNKRTLSTNKEQRLGHHFSTTEVPSSLVHGGEVILGGKTSHLLSESKIEFSKNIAFLRAQAFELEMFLFFVQDRTLLHNPG